MSALTEESEDDEGSEMPNNRTTYGGTRGGKELPNYFIQRQHEMLDQRNQELQEVGVSGYFKVLKLDSRNNNAITVPPEASNVSILNHAFSYLLTRTYFDLLINDFYACHRRLLRA